MDARKESKIQEVITTSAIQLGYSSLRDQQRLAVSFYDGKRCVYQPPHWQWKVIVLLDFA